MTAPAPLPADLDGGLRRLKLSAIRRLAPELLITARTQRWNPEEFLRTLIDAELAARDASNARARMKAAAFPVLKTIEEFDVAASSIPKATFDYLASLEWIRAAENYCAVGPAGTGKSHSLIALGIAAIQAGHKVRYFTAAELVETLYRGLADNSVGRVIENLLRADLIVIDEVGFAPLDDTGAQLLFRFVAAAYERRALGIGSHWPFDQWGRFLPEHTTAVSLLDRLLHHSIVVATEGESFRMKQARTRTPARLTRAVWSSCATVTARAAAAYLESHLDIIAAALHVTAHDQRQRLGSYDLRLPYLTRHRRMQTDMPQNPRTTHMLETCALYRGLTRGW
ncbi:DNA replication protein DnaC [Nonomuraea muscovyensis]|uniref:DNA replication protein DnaC n=1 Tax=Nonomuraea muscovyensis TaxID=1124761 RepID=A0A7X0C3Z5_9ACTN|nr:IS21-like element helper ATPase IstB [Nonomuraea muscovyensis]MBB6347753.1 DNA replication protein DnaC [Nonomuraea muscovyensis]